MHRVGGQFERNDFGEIVLELGMADEFAEYFTSNIRVLVDEFESVVGVELVPDEYWVLVGDFDEIYDLVEGKRREQSFVVEIFEFESFVVPFSDGVPRDVVEDSRG